MVFLSHFTDKETEAERQSVFPKATGACKWLSRGYVFPLLNHPLLIESTVPDSPRCLLTKQFCEMTDSLNNCLLVPTTGQALRGQRSERVPVITKFKSVKNTDKSTSNYKAMWWAQLRQGKDRYGESQTWGAVVGEKVSWGGWCVSDGKGCAGAGVERGWK